MKDVRLFGLKLKNFKGMREFDFGPNGISVNVLGTNGSGKTTLADAWSWLLFDKDTQNKSKFDIKTLDENNNVIHKLFHEVEGVLTVAGKKVTLHKVYKELWQVTRGTTDESFNGHETEYFVDGVPKKKTEYQATVNEIMKEDVFKLITSPTFFNEQIDWKDRRKTLLLVAGDITDQDVISSNSKLEGLIEILQDREIEDHKKVILSSQSKINESIKSIPIRIDEIRLSLPTEAAEMDKWNTQLEQIEKEINENNTLINNISNGQAIQDKKNEIKNKEYELQDLKRSLEGDSKEKEYSLKARLTEEESNLNMMKTKGREIVGSIESVEAKIQKYGLAKAELLKEYNTVDASQFSHNASCTCPTCGQDLPQSEIEAAREKALTSFKLNRSNKLAEIESQGKGLKAEIEKLEAEKVSLEKEKEKQVSLVNEKEKVLEKQKNDLNSFRDSKISVLDSSEYQNKQQELESLKIALNELNENALNTTSSLYGKNDELKRQRTELSITISKYAGIEAANERIAELEAQEKKWTDEYKRLSKELNLIDQFVKTKVNLLESRISDKFEFARFKLFKQNVNGGIEDTCETLYKGVNFSSLNNAARINVGLDIIRTLSKHYGIQAPIFIDNAESVVELVKMDAQVIRLVVSGEDKTLKVEEN